MDTIIAKRYLILEDIKNEFGTVKARKGEVLIQSFGNSAFYSIEDSDDYFYTISYDRRYDGRTDDIDSIVQNKLNYLVSLGTIKEIESLHYKDSKEYLSKIEEITSEINSKKKSIKNIEKSISDLEKELFQLKSINSKI